MGNAYPGVQWPSGRLSEVETRPAAGGIGEAVRGADLWHLSAAKSTQDHFPEVQLLTYDRKLMIAAQGEEIGL